jgi:hypothetical protein
MTWPDGNRSDGDGDRQPLLQELRGNVTLMPHFRNEKPIADSCHHVYESFVLVMERQARARLGSP